MSSAPERTVTVNTQPRPYPVYVGTENLRRLGERLREAVRGPRCAVVTDTNVGPRYADRVLASLKHARFTARLVTVPAGEDSKSLAVVARLYDEFAAAGLDRGSPVVALGGGVVGDLAGFAASTWVRGVPLVQCPTTLEADIDSSVGGKTGVNHAAGKNMIGAFHQPKFVLVDTSTLQTLSRRDFIAGLAESVKHAVIRDRDFFDWHEANVAAILAQDPDALGSLIERNIGIKAGVVAQDERETTGVRALLNFGHTVGHAIETAMARRGEPWRHGECVGVGMIAACEMSVASGRLDRASADRIEALLHQFGLPASAPLARFRPELMALMQADKKVAAGRIRFVLADAIGRATLYDDIQPAWIDAGLDRVLTS